jgi:hypothetical protein
MINEDTFRVLRTSAAYFADISATGRLLQRYITYGGLEASEITHQLYRSAPNTIEEIPVFTDLDIKDLTNVMVLPKWNYGIARPKYYTRRMRIQDSLSDEPSIIAQAQRNNFPLLQTNTLVE